MGAIPSAEVPALMSRHDALVLPSIWPENSPLVVREATAQGLPVIGPALGGCGELAPHALRVANADELLAAMETICREGRTRTESQRWPSPSEHAEHFARVSDKYMRTCAQVLRHQMAPLNASECRIMGRKKAVALFPSLDKVRTAK